MEIGHLTWAPTLEGPALAQEDERFGFDIRYFGDNTCMHSDVFSELRDAARATSKIKLGTSVTNTLTRHPSAVARARCRSNGPLTRDVRRRADDSRCPCAEAYLPRAVRVGCSRRCRPAL